MRKAKQGFAKSRVARHLAAYGAAVGLLLAVAAPVNADAATVWTAYVVNSVSNNVTPINTATNTKGTPIPVGVTPMAIAITPDGKTAYVANSSDKTVTPINLATNMPGTPIPVGTTPVAVAIAPNGQMVYVANKGSNNVTPISTATNTPGTPIPAGTNPTGVAITPDGKTAYVANNGSSNVTPITLASNTPGTPITVGSSPQGLAITPDGKTTYVANGGSGSSVTPINTATNTAGTPIPVGSAPFAVAITPDGKTAYVTNDGGGSVTPITIASNTAGTPITTSGGGQDAVAITPDGKTAYVANSGPNNVTPISVATNTAGTSITVGSSPSGVAITPDQAPAAAFSAVAGLAGSASGFDGSGSASAVGTIASYQWSFGDGQSATTVFPQTSHVYANPGSYTATLTVVNGAGTSLGQVFTGQTASNNGGPAAMTSHTITIPARPTPTPTPRSITAVFGNQQITLTTPSLLACTSSGNTLGVSLSSAAIAKSKAAKLKFASAAFYLDKGVKHTRKKTVRGRNGKKKTATVTTYSANATARHLPVALAIKTTGLKTGTHRLMVKVSYKQTKVRHRHKTTVTVTTRLTGTFRVC